MLPHLMSPLMLKCSQHTAFFNYFYIIKNNIYQNNIKSQSKKQQPLHKIISDYAAFNCKAVMSWCLPNSEQSCKRQTDLFTHKVMDSEDMNYTAQHCTPLLSTKVAETLTYGCINKYKHMQSFTKTSHQEELWINTLWYKLVFIND